MLAASFLTVFLTVHYANVDAVGSAAQESGRFLLDWASSVPARLTSQRTSARPSA